MRGACLGLFFLCGCAGLDAEACRSLNWYDIGFRDALYGMQPQDLAYADQCAPHNAAVDGARYAQGWREGRYEFDRRTSQSQD